MADLKTPQVYLCPSQEGVEGGFPIF